MRFSIESLEGVTDELRWVGDSVAATSDFLARTSGPVAAGVGEFICAVSSSVFVARRPREMRLQNDGRCFGAPRDSDPRSPGSARPRLSGGTDVFWAFSGESDVARRPSPEESEGSKESEDTGVNSTLPPRSTSGSLTPPVLSPRGSEFADEGVSGKTSSVDLSEISAPCALEVADSVISPPSNRQRHHTASWSR